MLARTSLIKPILDVNPQFEQVYKTLLAHDRYASFSYNNCMQYKLEDTHCVVRSDPATGKRTTDLMIFPFTVTMPSTNVFGTLHGGMLMTLIDMCTSFHIAERLLPNMPGHVSVNLSSSFITAAKKDDRVIAVCRVDKLGKRLAYTSVDFLLDAPSPTIAAMTTSSTRRHSSLDEGYGGSVSPCGQPNSAPTPAATDLEVVEGMLREYTSVAKGKHVKSIMSQVNLGHL